MLCQNPTGALYLDRHPWVGMIVQIYQGPTTKDKAIYMVNVTDPAVRGHLRTHPDGDILAALLLVLLQGCMLQ